MPRDAGSQGFGCWSHTRTEILKSPSWKWTSFNLVDFLFSDYTTVRLSVKEFDNGTFTDSLNYYVTMILKKKFCLIKHLQTGKHKMLLNIYIEYKDIEI